MKKKMICIFVCVLMIATALSAASSTGKNDINQTSSKITVDDGCNCDTYDEIVEEYGKELFFKCPIMVDPPAPLDPNDSSPKPPISDTPDEFSWKDYNGKDWTTPARHQGNCGSCWAFAVIASLESIIKIREGCAELDIDLSEQYVLSCLSRAGSCHGGSGYSALYYINDTSADGNYHNGVIPESCFPYQGNDEIPCSDKCQNWEEKITPISDYGQWIPNGSPNDIEAIKNQIIETGPVATHIKATRHFSSWGLTHNSPQDYYHYLGPVSFTNHLVVIVGWKDDSSIGHGGYWIVKNSWGSYWGYDGFFNIEYGSLHIDDSGIVWVDYDPSSIDWSPVADAGGPHGGHIGQEITFDASRSFDPEGNIPAYHWNFGDGSNDTGVIATHAYSYLGTYNVTLTVTDSNDQTASDTIKVWIQESNNPANKPAITGPPSGKASIRYTYTFVATDPDENDVYYHIEWGDDNVEEWIGPYVSGEEVAINRRCSEQGPYTITAKSKGVFDEESDWDYLEVSMPRNKQPINTLILRFLEKRSHTFPILRHLLEICTV